jgi:hypothetical protein
MTVAIVVERRAGRDCLTFTGTDRMEVLAEALHLWSVQRPFPLNAIPPDVHPHGGLWLSTFTRRHEEPANQEGMRCES